MNLRLKINDLVFTPKFDADIHKLVATIKFNAIVDPKECSDLATFATYMNNICVISMGDEKQLQIEDNVDKETGEIGGDEKD